MVLLLGASGRVPRRRTRFLRQLKMGFAASILLYMAPCVSAAVAEDPAAGTLSTTSDGSGPVAAVKQAPRIAIAGAGRSSWHDAAGEPSEIGVAVNKSRMISTDVSFRQIVVGNQEIADVVPLATNRFYVLGKKIGSTNVLLSDATGRPVAIFDILVGYDLESLKRALYEVAPDDAVEVRASGNGITLSGTVDSATKAANIVSLAESFAPQHVNNMLLVSGSQQVLLSVRFAEVQRSAMKDVGVNTNVTLFGNDGKNKWSFASGSGVNPEAFVKGGVTVAGARYALDTMIDALEEKGMVRTLAEPNIIALSGDTASFLAGGEFPIPVAQSQGASGSLPGYSAIAVEFKQFGVGLSFTPTVIGKEAINLEVNSEVSLIDPSVSFQNGSISVPGLSVRRTKTTVELLDGQSFAIAGLLQDNLNTAIRGLPGLQSLPILGTLFRSQNYTRRQSELVVIITVHLVRPTTIEKLAQPTDAYLPPKEFDFFLLGRPGERVDIKTAPGIDGKYGYATP